MIKMNLMRDSSEVVNYNEAGIPFYVQEGNLASYNEMRALCHWHKDIELIHVIEGEMNYYINGHSILLEKGDSLAVNSQHMHYGYANQKRDCNFICVLFHPSILYNNKLMYERYVQPIVENHSIEYFHYNKECENRELVGDIILTLNQNKENKINGEGLEAMQLLYKFWGELYRQCQKLQESKEAKDDTERSLQKEMVSYIHQNYAEMITLDEVAASANVSRSKCCSIFRKYLQQSPIEFLNAYRLEVSRRLLVNTEWSILQIANACGFNHQSYYSKLFMRKYGCTPNSYRRENRTV